MGELMQRGFMVLGAGTAVGFVSVMVIVLYILIFHDEVKAIVQHYREERTDEKFFEMIEEFRNDFV